MSEWQVAMTIIVTLYALMGAYAVLATLRAWGQIDLDRPEATYCPDGSACRLCGQAREAAERPGAN